MIRWPLALAGLGLFVFGVVALTGPGRIDIEDGQARFEAGRNLVDHGDTVLRDDRLTWNTFQGRDGKQFTDYRLPQIAVAAAMVKASDLLTGIDESRRHFAFSLHGAVCAALIAILLAVYFRMEGMPERKCLVWAALGIFATPCWYYATSTFDEILTTLMVVLMLVTARAAGSIPNVRVLTPEGSQPLAGGRSEAETTGTGHGTIDPGGVAARGSPAAIPPGSDNKINAIPVVSAALRPPANRSDPSGIKYTRSLFWIVISAVAAGVLYNCKPPIIALTLPALALATPAGSSKRRITFNVSTMILGVVLGHLVMSAYHEYKFPPDARSEYDRIRREEHPPTFFGNVPEAVIDLAVGPSSGMIWYFPPLLLIIASFKVLPSRLRHAYLLSSLAIIGFVSLLVFYKGGVCWGPRYLTPLFAAGWLFAPLGASRLSPFLVKLLLGLGVFVQLLGLSAIPERLYLQRELPTDFYIDHAWWYLHPQLGHIVNRPREIVEIINRPRSELVSPSPTPTYTLPIFHPKYFPEPQGNAALEKYQILGGARFWWAWMPASVVDAPKLILLLLSLSLTGLLLTRTMSRP